jgi:phosphoglycerate dehydrogenase-like enzyme
MSQAQPQENESVPACVVTDFRFDDADLARLQEVLGQAPLVRAPSRTELPDILSAHPETDVLCTFRPPQNVFDLAPRLRWIALPSAGADPIVRGGFVRPGGPVVTTASGVHAVPIAEYVFAMLLMWVRNWPAILDAQRAHTWARSATWEGLRGRELHGATLGIIGLGAIGRQVAHLGRYFGMHVLATRRSVSPGTTDPDVDELIPASDLLRLLAAADFVVIAAPSTPETHHHIGADQLRAMKHTGVLVNIARGDIVDEPALIDALRSGTIAGAALDVFEIEPLPETSPLWTLPNVIIAPHLAGSTGAYSRRFTDLFLENLRRYRSGNPLLNVVDPVRGY